MGDIDGDDTGLSESQLISKLIREHKEGDKVSIAVLRIGKRIRLADYGSVTPAHPPT